MNGSLGIVQRFEANGQHILQTAAIQKGIEMAEGRRLPLPPRYPRVLFSNGQEVLCAPASFQVLNGKGEVEATRDQACAVFLAPRKSVDGHTTRSP